MLQAFERIMSAVTFAEAGEHETAQHLVNNGSSGPEHAKKTQTAGIGLAETARQYMRAITFAEEGESVYAQEALQAITPAVTHEKTKRILVLGNEDTFADYLIEYALEMAERFNYEIIALNALPLSKKTRILSGFADEIAERFRHNAERAGLRFQSKAEERGIAFRQEIRLMSEQKALRSLHKETSDIEFVLTEPEPSMTDEQASVCDGAVCVCSLVG